LYAAEANRLLSLFRDWFTAQRSQGLRQEGYKTASGEMIEFYADTSTAAVDLRREFDSFSSFLTLCHTNEEAAVDLLVEAQLGPADSRNLVDRFRREINRLELDMRYDRAGRLLSIQRSLEEELLERGLNLASLPSGQLTALVDHLVPAAGTAAPLALLASPNSEHSPQVHVQISNNYIEHASNLVLANIAGNVNLTPQAQQLLGLVERFGGHDAANLQSAVYELEDSAAPAAERSSAKRRLLQFLGQLGDVAKDVGGDLLTKYLESKGL
jgi:hypothetical protein